VDGNLETSAPAPTAGTNKKKKRRAAGAAVAFAMLFSAGPALANVLIQNFMTAEFSAGPPPCLIKTAGEDVTSFPDGFGFDTATVTTVDGVDVTQESITINGVTGDRVTADEVFVIENNCTVPLDVSIGTGAAAGDWAGKHLEVWLGNPTNTGAYPTDVAPEDAQWDQAPLVFDPTGVTNAATGVVTIAAGDSVPVGMIVTTASAATGSGTATWVVQAETN